MDFELFQQGPEEYIPRLLLSLAVTVALYSAFPLIFAKMRKKQMVEKKYRRYCYVFNFIAAIFFKLLDGDTTPSLVPYLLWTWVFVQKGEKILQAKGILSESQKSEHNESIPSEKNAVVEEERTKAITIKQKTAVYKGTSEIGKRHQRLAIRIAIISACLIPLLCFTHVVAEAIDIDFGAFYITNDVIAFFIAPLVCICSCGFALHSYLKERRGNNKNLKDSVLTTKQTNSTNSTNDNWS